MHRQIIDRWTDTTVFRVALVFAALPVVPVLFLGLNATVMFGVAALAGELGFAQLAMTLLSVGGALGFVGYLRAHGSAKDPWRYNVTATLAFLTAGVVAALCVAVFVSASAIEGWFDPWEWRALSLAGALFAAANLVWAVAGIGSMQRLLRLCAESEGRNFDGLPVVLLFVAIGLAVAAALAFATL